MVKIKFNKKKETNKRKTYVNCFALLRYGPALKFAFIPLAMCFLFKNRIHVSSTYTQNLLQFLTMNDNDDDDDGRRMTGDIFIL